MTVRPDNRLTDAPMVAVHCRACEAKVLVRKSSWEQTSVQWDAESSRRCHRRPPVGNPGRAADPSQFFALCPELRTSIQAAVQQGVLPILHEA